MIELRSDIENSKEFPISPLPLVFHSSFYEVHEKLNKWLTRFPLAIDNSIFNDLTLLYLLASKKFLDHRNSSHLFRLVLSMHLMDKKLLRSATFSPHLRHLEIRWLKTDLLFPFSNKPVLGCLIGFNLMDRYEVFDEENIVLALQKYLPQLRLVKESSYCHTSQHKNFKIFYFEIEKKNGSSFSLLEQSLLKNNLEEKVKKSIQPLSPTIFMAHNDEEIYKNILVLSQEIQSLQDIPQAYITLDQQTGKEIIFRVTLVHITPFHRFTLKERFNECSFVLQRVLTVKQLENHPIEANIFRLHLNRDPSLLRSDGSLDFYIARQKVVAMINSAIGEFRDYNGGILIKQQELLRDFKESFPEITSHDTELVETFFYAITPIEKQVVLPKETLSNLFSYFLDNQKEKTPKDSIYSFKISRSEKVAYIVVKADDSSLITNITNVLEEQRFAHMDIAYNFLDTADGVFFNCAILQTDRDSENLIKAIQDSLHKWHQKMKDRQVLRIGLEYSVVSLDPRIGGETASGDILRLLFEGLTRFSQNGVENAMAEFIDISPNKKHYTFKLRNSFWNDGSPVTAHDFEYAWKKILSPDFKTAFAYLFYPIKNAKEAKEGKVSEEQIGIQVVDDRTLKIELCCPTPHFLQLLAYPIYSPVHRLIDQQHPQWPYECEKNYPCNGAFQLKINHPKQGFQLIKNPYYWDAKDIVMDQITMTVMPPSQAIQAFHKKEIDWVGTPFGGWHSFYTPTKDDNVISLKNSHVFWCMFNTAKPPFHHCKLRQAIGYAIRREEITADSFLKLSPAYSPVLPFYRESCQAQFPDYDPKKARELFQEALDEMGISKEDIPPIDLIFHEKGERSIVARILKKQFKECLDIDCELKPLPWNSVFRNLQEGSFQMTLMSWTSWVDDPIYTLNPFKTAQQEANFAKWEHTEFQRYLELSEQEINPYQRSSHLLMAERILSQEMPVIPLFYQGNQALVNKDLHVVCRNPCGPFNISKSFYKKEL